VASKKDLALPSKSFNSGKEFTAIVNVGYIQIPRSSKQWSIGNKYLSQMRSSCMKSWTPSNCKHLSNVRNWRSQPPLSCCKDSNHRNKTPNPFVKEEYVTRPGNKSYRIFFFSTVNAKQLPPRPGVDFAIELQEGKQSPYLPSSPVAQRTPACVTKCSGMRHASLITGGSSARDRSIHAHLLISAFSADW
jgi:hypothetical protein